MRGREWTNEDLEIFLKEYKTADIKKLCKKLNRTPSALYSKAIKLGIVREPTAIKPIRRKLLTDEEYLWFKRNYAELSNKTIAVILKLTVPSVKRLALRYGLRKSERYRKECKEYSYNRKRKKIDEWQNKNPEKVKEYKQRYIKRKNGKEEKV